MPVWNSIPRTWATGEKITAALLNAQLRDPLAALGGTWNTYTPTLAQGASSNIAKTVSYAKYIQFGKLIICNVVLSVTAAGTSGSPVTVTMPVASASAVPMIGSGAIYDNGYGFRPAVVVFQSTTQVVLARTDIDTGSGVGLGQDPAFALASGDSIFLNVTYEAA